MEKNLSYQPYKTEWEKIGRGNDKKLYQPFTKIELYVPWVFSILYAFFMLTILFSYI